MSEQDSINERCAGSAESAIPEREVGAIAEGRVSQANSFEEIASLAESIKAMNRPLISQQLAESIKAMNRPLISQQLAESIKAMNRPLISQQLAKSIKAMNWPLISQQLAKSIKAMNRPLISQQLAKSIAALNLNVATLSTPWFKESLDVRGFTSLNFPRQSVRLPHEKPRIRASSDVVEVEDTAPARERQHWVTLFDFVVQDDGLRRVCRKLFADGYYALAVLKAWIYIDNMVRQKSRIIGKDGADLMRAAFSPKNPVLRLNDMRSRSDENQQQGYMEIFAGSMIGIRNPRAHEHNLDDNPEEALEMLVMANHLMRMLNQST